MTVPRSMEQANPSVAPGQMILLNGTSSSGKTTLARALQAALLPQVWLHIDVDQWRTAHPDRFCSEPGAAEKGAAMQKLMCAIPDGMATLLHHGNNLIVDDTFGPAQLKNYVDTLYPTVNPLFIGIQCAIAELDHRESVRTDRPRGTARGLLKSVSTPGVFDIEVDTTALSPETAADLVIALLRSGIQPDAFARLSQMDLAQIVANSQVRWAETTFINHTPESVRIYMVDIWENRQLRHTIPPGETRVQPMSNAHPWEIHSTNGTLLQAFLPNGTNRTIEILPVVSNNLVK